MEGWPSGLRRTLGKRVYVKAYRGFESHSLRHFRTELRTPGRSRPYAGRSGQRLKQIAFRSDDADLAVCDLDGLRLVVDSLQLATRSFSAGSSRSATPASMAS
jgi:hypothetical protein